MNKIERMKRSIKKRKYKGVLASIIWLIILIMLGSKTTYNDPVKQITVIIIVFGFLCVTSMIWLLLYGWKKNTEYWIENEKLKETLPKQYGISQDNFTEIHLRYDEDEIKTTIKKKLGAKYYAKIISYDEIEVILKDKDGDLLKKPEHFKNFHEFYSKYKPLWK